MKSVIGNSFLLFPFSSYKFSLHSNLEALVPRVVEKLNTRRLKFVLFQLELLDVHGLSLKNVESFTS